MHISVELYVCDQRRKAVGRLEDRKTMPNEGDVPPRQQVLDCRIDAMQDRVKICREGGNCDSTPEIW